MEQNALALAGNAADPFGSALNDFVTMATELARGNKVSPEEEYLQSLSPVDAHKFAVEARNARRYTPAEASANLRQTGMDALYVTPVIGNALSAYDAYRYGKETVAAPDDTSRRKAAIMTELSALGAITGLPFGNAATRAAKGAARRTNIFAGPMAKTADRSALENAQRLEASGASRDEIWAQTGWFKGKDGKWRFEIDDSQMIVNIPRNSMSGQYNAYKTAIDHPHLFESYPPMQRNRITFDHRMDDSSIALERPGSNVIGSQRFDTDIGIKGRVRWGDRTAATRPEAIKSSTAHEVQHNAQAREGFATGNDPQAIFDDLMAANPKMSPEEATRTALDMYRRSAGEVEARNVQARMNMSAAERRAKAPWLTQDVPDEDQIVRFGDWVARQEQPQTFGDWMSWRRW